MPLDSAKAIQPSVAEAVKDIPDFSTNLPFEADTRELQEKRKQVMKQFLEQISPAGALYDTLVDINYDGHRDYLIGYYGLAGTGFKYRIEAYLYSPRYNYYFHNNPVSELINPGFFLAQHKITGFYIGLGGGHGQELEWIKNEWTLTKEFEVENAGDSTVWKINYPLTNKKEEVRLPFTGIPPDMILATNPYLKSAQ